MSRQIVRYVVIIAAVYFAGYLSFRQTNQEVWTQDGRPYVIFPESAVTLYYLWRPLTYIDGALTGMGFHIGPHR